MLSEGGGLRFVPSRVEGLPAVTEVAVYPDRLELLSAGRWVSFRFEDIAAWPSPAFIRQWLARLGWRPHWLPVGERKWFDASVERFYCFYTWPQIVVYMPPESEEIHDGRTLFRRVQDVMLVGGFRAWDLT